MRKAGLFAVVVSLAIAGYFAAQVVFADWAGTGYLWRNEIPGGNCAIRLDPVNLVFYNQASASTTASQIQYHMGWTNTEGSGMWFNWTHGDKCRPVSAQRASASGTSTRYHVRIGQPDHGDPTWGTYSSASAHYEKYKGCYLPPWEDGHVVQSNGFNITRDGIALTFYAAGHEVLSAYWGNTSGVQQCDLTSPSSDGWSKWIRLP